MLKELSLTRRQQKLKKVARQMKMAEAQIEKVRKSLLTV